MIFLGHVGLPIGHPCRKQYGSGFQGPIRRGDDKVPTFSGQGRHASASNISSILDGLPSHPIKQVASIDPAGKAGVIMRHRNARCSTGPVVEDRYGEMKPGEIDRSRQPGRSTTDDDAVSTWHVRQL